MSIIAASAAPVGEASVLAVDAMAPVVEALAQSSAVSTPRDFVVTRGVSLD